MPINMREYIDAKRQTIHSSPEELARENEQLEMFFNKLLHFSPSFLDTRQSGHYSNKYREKIENKENHMTLITWMIECIFHPITISRETLKSSSAFWGSSNLPTDLKKGMRLYLVVNAAIFSCTSVGNCAKRSAYAAIELFELLKQTDVTIQMISYPEIDQFVLKLGNEREGWKIYDPLTNPELLFEEEEYTQIVKPLFQPASRPLPPFAFTVDLKTIGLFDFQLKKIARFLSEERLKTTINTITTDLKYLSFLVINNIRDPRFEQTHAAYSEVCDILGWDDPTSDLHNGLI